MKFVKYAFLAVILATILPCHSAAKAVVTPRAYMFGFIANFSDSVVYFTDIQRVDSVWYDHKTKFLLGRSSYANQLRDHFSNNMKMPHRTCVVIYGLTRNDIEKKFLKMKKIYTKKFAGQYDVRTLNENEFHFTSVDMSPEDQQQIVAKPAKADKKKPRKNAKRQSRDRKRPPRK